jgi:rsbT co-antagonist protein RsbR
MADHTDSTELAGDRRTPAELHQEVELSANLLETAPTFMAAIDGNGKTALMNQTMLNALGYTREEVIGQDYMTTFVPERDRELLGQTFARLATMQGATVNENRVCAKDGSELLVEWHGRAIPDAAGNFKYYLGVGIDVTERRKVENALRRSEQKLALHVQQTPLAVIEWNFDFEVVEWNPAAERIFGYPRAEALGQHAAGLIIPESARPHVDVVWRDLLTRKGGTRSTNENFTKTGEIIVCEWYNTPLIDSDGNVIGVASLVQDVTEQKRIETELRDRERAQAATISRLSTPILDLWEGVLTLPVIGAVDEERASRMTESVLEAISRTRAAFTIIDLTGMDGVDASTADHLLRLVQTTQLLGSRCLVSGISPAAAQTMVQLGRGLDNVSTFSTLRAALGFVLRQSAAIGR